MGVAYRVGSFNQRAVCRMRHAALSVWISVTTCDLLGGVTTTEERDPLMPKSEPRKIIRPLLQEYFMKRTGETVYLADICNELKLGQEQVKSGVLNLRNCNDHWKTALRVQATGRAWSYHPNSSSGAPTVSKRVFEEVGPTNTGDIVIQDDQGKLYRATEL